MEQRAEPYELHDADKLIKFAQALVAFAPPSLSPNDIKTSEALDLLRFDPEEVLALYDLYVNCYKLYIER